MDTATPTDPVIPSPILDRLLAECFGRPMAYRELGRLCDTVGGRTSGTESGRLAEEWGQALFADWGLDRVWFEQFPVAVWERGPLEAEVLGPSGWRLTALAHGNSPASADLEAEVLDVGHGDREDFERLRQRVPGAVALCDEGAAPGKRALHRSEKLALAAEFGAAGLMIYSSAAGPLPRTGVCADSPAPIPSLGIGLEDGERLLRQIRDGLSPNVRIRMTNRVSSGVARNVLARLDGRVPDEVVLAGAHLDSWDVAQGAVDNGLGCAIVLEAARTLAALGERPRRSIVFALWAAEEVGICGSYEYARAHRDALAQHVAVMNFDMTGDPYGYWTPMRREPEAMLRGLARGLAPVGMREEFAHEPGLHSDHQAFMLAGVPVVCLMAKLPNDAGRYYHSAGDTFDKVSLPAMCRAAMVAAATLWTLADSPEPAMRHLTTDEVRHHMDSAGLLEALNEKDWVLEPSG
ncbi:MAG: hypothetical protein AMXMBFR61_22750 [Fimbriimonadales bacterium]